jgi:hypothetical protein
MFSSSTTEGRDRFIDRVRAEYGNKVRHITRGIVYPRPSQTAYVAIVHVNA